MNWLKSMGTKSYTYHDIIAISTPLNWFGPRIRHTTVAALVKMGLEWKLWKECGRNYFIFCQTNIIPNFGNLLFP
jgi:hypothetical protein